MSYNGPPPPLGLKKTYRVNRPPAVVPPEIRNPLVQEAQELLNRLDLNGWERQQISTLMRETDPANLAYLQVQMQRTRERLGLLQGGRRRRRRTRRTRRNKRSTRRR